MVAVMRTGPGDEPESTDNDSDTHTAGSLRVVDPAERAAGPGPSGLTAEEMADFGAEMDRLRQEILDSLGELNLIVIRRTGRGGAEDTRRRVVDVDPPQQKGTAARLDP